MFEPDDDKQKNLDLSPSATWIEAAAKLKARGEAFVMVTVLSVHGSAPRNAGTKMLVWSGGIIETIGGGHLEYKAIAEAKAMLDAPKSSSQALHKLEEYPLGPQLGQCCGGKVSLLYELFNAAEAEIILFGAGHVGKALVSVLSQLPLCITWVDQRQDEFPESIPQNTKAIVSDAPFEEVAQIPSGSIVIVMTHNHAMDFDIVRAALARNDLDYVGVIGSRIKAKRFRKRLEHRGFSPEKINFLKCPIGLSAVPGKHPMEVAVSVAGEIIALYHARKKPAPHSLPRSQQKHTAFLPAPNTGGTRVDSE